MKNDSIEPLEALASLPRETASEDFARRVLVRLAEREGDSPRVAPPRLLWATAGALALATVVAAGLYERQRERRELRGELSTMRREQLELQRELDALRAARELPVVYLGGDERNDYVLTMTQTTTRR